ncbi:MAG: carbamate kinase [Lachnospiraceae bacterium]
MKREVVVVALGRNALGKTLPEQKKAVEYTAEVIADIVEAGYQVVITHSNGPQIGMLHTAMTEFSRMENDFTAAPMSVCGALSQGYIGYDLQNAVRTALLNRGIYKSVCTIITQVRVDPFDKAFQQPSKVIGRVMNADDAEAEVQKGNYVIEVEGGYRRNIPSPKPIDIYEIDAIRTLAEAGQIVIACGGGGIPVLQQGTKLKGASAIIEKDLTAARLAQMLDADTLLYLTGQEFVTFDKDENTVLKQLTVAETEGYISEGRFDRRTKLPKMEGAVEFVSSGDGRRAVITSLDHALDGLKERTGTIIK